MGFTTRLQTAVGQNVSGENSTGSGLLEPQYVITSYSIHYTKLYDLNKNDWIDFTKELEETSEEFERPSGELATKNDDRNNFV